MTLTDVTPTGERPTLWSVLPGWGIAADLIPPELIQSRQLMVLRRLIAAGVVVLLLVTGSGFYLAWSENSSASSDLVSAQDRTAQLLAVGRGYSDVVSIQGTIGQVQTQLAQVMSADVDLAALMGELSSNLPATMTIDHEAITISEAGVAGATDGATSNGLDSSGLPRIGTVTMSGTGQTLNDLSDYIDRLQTIAGLVDVLPISNSVKEGSGTEFSLTAGLTNALLSHRYDVGG